MNITIAANHTHFHIGGTEAVLKAIADSMANDFHHNVNVLGCSVTKAFEDNNVKYHHCSRDYLTFIKHVHSLGTEHLFIYSDYFYNWPGVLENARNLKFGKSIALVGANALRGSEGLRKKFQASHQHFNVITHSDNYKDYQECERMNVPVTVIPNGVDLDEFDTVRSHKMGFRTKYDIYEEGVKIILCVSNFFPGKGQEYLVKVLDKLKSQRNDFIAVFVSATVNFKPAQILAQRCQSELKRLKIPHKFLTDIPREDVVAAFNEAAVFAFPSQKEVAPIVLLECGAAMLPWIAMPVGNVRQLKGGLMIPHNAYDGYGFARYGEMSYKMFLQHLNDFLDNCLFDCDFHHDHAYAGYEFVKENHNWKKIMPVYDEIFCHGRQSKQI
tara:strand:- start:1337 stop:2488 length:1152 start_codon:yes stop_codon:yes gene_type:complete